MLFTNFFDIMARLIAFPDNRTSRNSPDYLMKEDIIMNDAKVTITDEYVRLQKKLLDRSKITVHYYKSVKYTVSRLDEFYLRTMHLYQHGMDL